MENNNTPVKLEITQDKLVDLLMHAATREDIAALRQETTAKFDKIDQRFEKVDQRFEKVDQRFDKLDQKIDLKMEAMEARMDRAEARMDRKFFAAMSITIASAIAIIGILLRGFHMFQFYQSLVFLANLFLYTKAIL